jgi:hypothetical protein
VTIPSYLRSVTVALVAGCGNAEAPALGTPTSDTLAGGIVRVRNDVPMGWRNGSAAWQVTEELRISGDEGTESEIINPQSLALDASGRVWVADQSPARLKLYGRDGRLVRVVAREGEGPGEFRVGFIVPAGTYLVLHDPQQSRTSVFDSAGTFLRSFPSQCCYHMAIGADPEGGVLIAGMAAGEERRGQAWYRYSLEGKLLDTTFVPRLTEDKFWTVGDPKRMMMNLAIPFTPRIEAVSHPAGGFLLGHSGTYQLARIRQAGDTALLFGRSWTPQPVTDQDRRDIIERMIPTFDQFDEATLRRAFHAEDIPAVRPAFSSLWVDQEGYSWVLRDSVEFDVFDPAGGWLGELIISPSLSTGTAFFGRARITSSVEQSDGRPVVVVWRVDKLQR